jgi:outer membrane protein assembly factor BamB
MSIRHKARYKDIMLTETSPWLPIIDGMRLACLLLCALSSSAQVSVLTYHNDLARTGQNLQETILSPSSIHAGRFGQLFTYAVDGQVYAQPLYLQGVNIPGQGVYNVVFVVTEHDSVYALDADGNAAEPLWHVNFTNPTLGITTASADDLQCAAIAPEVGITGTPVIDPASGTLYVVAMTLEYFAGNYVQRLHALDLTTGAERPGSPVEIQASTPGTGDGNTVVKFNAGLYKQRPGLLLLNGVIYTAWSSHCDAGRYHGWLIGYDAKTLQQVALYIDTPNWDAGSFWQSGAAPAADASGNIFVVSGNGTFDTNLGGTDLGESIIKLSTAKGLAVADYFTPFNSDLLSEKELDLGSSGALLLPDAAGSPAHPHLAVSGSKEGRIYVIDRDNMGHFQPGSDSQIVQSMESAVGPLFGIPVYFNNTVYFSGANDALKAFSAVDGRLSKQPIAETAATFAFPGAVPSISANGAVDGIVWLVDPTGQLHAFDAIGLKELYHASVGSYVKFSTPTIANGKVYVGTMNSVVVFGLRSERRPRTAVVRPTTVSDPRPLSEPRP